MSNPSHNIQTNRLRIHPLSSEEFSAFLNGGGKLEESLGILPLTERLSSEFQMNIEWLALQMILHSQDFPWRTLWIIICPDKKQGVGFFYFCGKPDDQGGIEIVFEVYRSFQSQGIMTEALRGIAAWGLTQESVRYMMAEAETWNLPALRVLEKNGFRRYRTTEESEFFCLTREDFLALSGHSSSIDC